MSRVGAPAFICVFPPPHCDRLLQPLAIYSYSRLQPLHLVQSASASSADFAVLETTLPADSTDERVVRRRAALAAALAYEYERMNWLVGYSINYRVDGEGVPRPDDSWKR